MSEPGKHNPLRLIAADAEDLKVISACLQDAVAKIGDFAWLPAERRFAFVSNRFVWELAANRSRGPFWRTRTGAHFNDVRAVQQMNLRTDVKDAVLELLAVRFEPVGEDGGGEIYLDFAGGGAIRLEVDAVNCEIADLSAPWRTRARPRHEV